MQIKILKQEKEELEIELDNLTVAELLRNELWNEEVEVSAWKREHPTKNPVLIIRTKGKDAKKVLLDAIEKIQEKNQEILKEFKKAFK
jgi:DNA-directed RNA polymerase subunit L